MTASADLGAEIIVHLARLAQNGGSHRLTSAQWSALRFFARANRLSRTPSAFSAFHATTRGTASQTVKSLVEQGLLERHRNEADGRSVRYDLTEAGREALAEDPLRALAQRLEQLPETERGYLLAALKGIAGDLAVMRESTSFGTCADCAYCDAGSDGKSGEDCGSFCRCAAETLRVCDMEALCVEFRPRKPASDPQEHAH